MAAAPAEKLRIREGYILRTINANKGFRENLGPLPNKVNISATAQNPNQVYWFVQNRAQVENEIHLVLSLKKPDTVCWIYFPKGSSKIQTDLTRDKGWDKLMSYDFQWISLISFNDTWSAFGIRPKNPGDRKRETRGPWSNPGKAAKAASFFNELSFTNKKEYIEWVVSANREETRSHRIIETIERLEKGWKNPANR